jgi:2-amino-4-hydroxy-6-hydroxymethyldihydropteridine diphosphokinase
VDWPTELKLKSLDNGPEQRAMSVIAYLGLGSNLGDRIFYLCQAARDMEIPDQLKVCRVSGIYETEPLHNPLQPDYLNGVLEIETTLPLLSLLNHVQQIEMRLGRERLERWGPRTIDIDILSVADVVRQDINLTLPHPRMAQRRFVLMPLAELAPQYLLPKYGRTVLQLLHECPSDQRAALYMDAQAFQQRILMA